VYIWEFGVNFPAVFLESEGGIKAEKGFLKKAPTIQHDYNDIHAAQKIAETSDLEPLGLIYRDSSIPTYQDIREQRVAKLERPELVNKLNQEFAKYSVKS